MKDKIQGGVILLAVIGANGKPLSLRVLQGLPDGLDQAALETVKNWRFNPAKDKNQEPIAVRQIIEVFFHLF